MLKTLRLLLSQPQPKALDDVLAESFSPKSQRSAEQVSDFCSCFLFLNVQSNSKQFIFYPATLAPEVIFFFFPFFINRQKLLHVLFLGGDPPRKIPLNSTRRGHGLPPAEL